MNKQIQQLAEQAGLYVDLNGAPWPKCMSAEECELAYEKFVQLIVQECSRVAKLEVGTNRVCDAIEKHFGVES
jgi:hypothetical protein